MADDPYKVLGVPRDASEEAIKAAFRKLAKENHPDVNPKNRAQAEERFKKVNAAFAVVGDAEKRGQFDRGEIDAAGEPRRAYTRAYADAGPFSGRTRGGQATGDFDFGFGDIFSDIFGNRGRPAPFAARGQDVRYTLEVDFLEAALGAKKRVTLPEGGMLDLTVPSGVTDGQVLRLKGKGGRPVRGGEPGDALVEIKVRTHPDFERVGADIHTELPITIDEAVLGAKVEVATISGRVQLTIPRATSSGRLFRLKGRGVHNAATGATGDQLVKIRIVLPATIDDKLAYFMSEWRQKHRYDPGRKS